MQLILGSSGSGKSYRLYQNIIDESIENQSTNYILIVPEQFNMQTQREIIAMHPYGGTMNIDISSFKMLAFKVFEEVGDYNKTILEDIGKSMILRKVVESRKKELQIFSGNIKKTGFINELKNLISELYEYGIDNAKLLKAIDISSQKPILNNKLKDVFAVYNGFKEFLSNKFITSEEILDILSNSIHKSNTIKNSIIYLDGFTGFTPSQYRLIGELIKYSKDLKIAVTIDTSENVYIVGEEYKLFYTAQKTISKLIDVENSVKSQHEAKNDLKIVNKVNPRFKNSSAIASLEKNLFRYHYSKFNMAQDNVSIHISLNPNEEVEFVAREILNLVRQKKYRYRDIAVVTGDIHNYSILIDKIFSKNNIPCFIDSKKSIMSNPFVELIRSVLEIVIKDFSYDSVFRYLRCGLSGIQREDVDILENYVLATGLRGNKMWQKNWARKYKKLKDIDYDKLNNLRKIIVENILPLRNELKNKNSNVKTYITAIWNFIDSLNVESQLNEYRNRFLENRQLMLTKEYEQIYTVVLDILDKTVELFGDEYIDVKELASILDTGFEEVKMGIIPPSVDQILVGDIERTRLNNVKALFFIGVNDGIIPKTADKGGIISDIEKQTLLDSGIEMSPTLRQNAYAEKFYLYLNLTKPSEKLYISFSKVGSNGKSIKQSYIIGTVEKLFPNINKIDESNRNTDINLISNYNSSMKFLTEGLRKYSESEMSDEWKELYSWYYSSEKYRDKILKLVDATFYSNRETRIKKSTATALYGKQLLGSITRIEKYASCAYAHFLDYGLQLNQREYYRFTAPDMGNIFHQVIELFSTKIVEKNKSWNDIDNSERDKLVEKCVKQITDKYSVLEDSARNAYMIKRVNRISKRTIWALQQQIKCGKFIPSEYEIQFSIVEDLNSANMSLNEFLKLEGKIDRVDRFEDDKNVYIKIIDYKSGNTSFDILALYYGLQLQLVVYMNAAIELEKSANQNKHVIPAGVFYYNIDDPIVDIEDDITTDKINKKLLSELKMNGVVNSDGTVINLIDSNYDGKKSEIISVKNSTASESQIESLSKYVNKKIKEFGKEILDGNIEINPYKLNDKNACEYCQYRAICGFEPKLESNRYRKLKNYDLEQTWKLIEQNGGDDKIELD